MDCVQQGQITNRIQRGHRLATTGGAKALDAYTQHRKGVDNRPPKVKDNYLS